MDPLVSAHILLGAEQKRQLRFWAADRGTSMAVLIREAVDYYLRVAVGPSPRNIRRAARDAAGAFPLECGAEVDSSSGPGGLWLQATD